jgi:hypothetical protein
VGAQVGAISVVAKGAQECEGDVCRAHDDVVITNDFIQRLSKKADAVILVIADS